MTFHPPSAELAAIERTLHDVALRLAAIGLEAKADPAGERLSVELFAVESQVRAGVRRLDSVVRRLR